uniref:Uncharacterized protein n=1 Tax=Siphoviridae sp. ct47y1 TaxID=2827775 RepID=A0A8S5TA58_9CAUD|nr:MAG TPA: hypothetical protein [Siphoviridae sp. ct47y1]DAI79084.1 MAG TPA: hypothetical protein [Caudoviricetes sp.]
MQQSGYCGKIIVKVNIGNLFCYFRDCKRTTMEELS